MDIITNKLKEKNILTKVILLDNENIEEQLKKSIPDIVVNRSRNYVVAEWLEQKGVKVLNNSFVTKCANDKLSTYRFLKDQIDFMPLLEAG